MAIINKGYDLFSVVKGSTYINLENIFPGAEIINSNGIPIDQKKFGNFSTGIERKSELPDNENGAIPIEMFAEHSISIKPINLEPFDLGKGDCDFHTIINRGGILRGLPNTDGLIRPSEGVMTVFRKRGGGEFELSLNINPLIVLTKVGGKIEDLNGEDVIKTIDGSGLLNPVGSIGGQWSENISQNFNYVRNSDYRNGGFFCGINRVTSEPITIQLTSGKTDAHRLVQLASTI